MEFQSCLSKDISLSKVRTAPVFASQALNFYGNRVNQHLPTHLSDNFHPTSSMTASSETGEAYFHSIPMESGGTVEVQPPQGQKVTLLVLLLEFFSVKSGQKLRNGSGDSVSSWLLFRWPTVSGYFGSFS